MKRFLIPLLATFILPAAVEANWFKGKSTQWPTSWSEFDSPPLKEARPFVVVEFLDSIEEACKEFNKAEKLWKIFENEHDLIARRLFSDYKKGLITESEFNENQEKKVAWQKVWPRKYKMVSTSVEVLRQADYPDWKLYSRYNISGVGDLWRKEIIGEKNKENFDYAFMGPIEASKVCRALMP